MTPSPLGRHCYCGYEIGCAWILSQDAALTIDADALDLASSTTVEAMVTGEALEVTAEDGRLRIPLAMGREQVRLIQLSTVERAR